MLNNVYPKKKSLQKVVVKCLKRKILQISSPLRKVRFKDNLGQLNKKKKQSQRRKKYIRTAFQFNLSFISK